MKTTPNKLNSNINPEIQRLTEYLIETATTYNLEALNDIYSDNLKFIRIDENKRVSILNKKDNMSLFRNLRDIGAAPLSKDVEFHYADSDGEKGFILLTRKMQLENRMEKMLFNIFWGKGKWGMENYKRVCLCRTNLNKSNV